MKKLKIFLMLSILLCFGFALSFEVHAQGGGPKIFEVGDVLPTGKIISISWDFTEYYVDLDNVAFYINGYTDDSDLFHIQISYYHYGFWIRIELPNGDYYYDENLIGNTTITLEKDVTITSFMSDGMNNEDYFEYVDGAIFWKALSEEELNYQEGYSNGYQAAQEYYGWYEGGQWFTGDQVWIMSYENARDEFGYYDPITNRWLSVTEYLDLYGTEKPGQSDFYNNFDKYFIPAMIIVFGGAIVLTILKVFKGRE